MTETKHTPGPWTVGPYAMDVNGPSEKGGTFKVCDIRGWGYFTGKGHGALGLPADVAIARQTANARLIAAAPDLLEGCKLAMRAFENGDHIDWSVLSDAIEKAEKGTP